MSDGRKLIMTPFTGRKKEKLGIRLQKNMCQQKKDKTYLKQTGDRITIKRMVRRSFRR